MKNYYRVLIVVLILGSFQVQSDNTDDKKFKVTASWQREQASSWYGPDSDSISSLRPDYNLFMIDSTKVDENNNVIYDTTFTDYTADNYRNTFKIEFDWHPIKYIHIGAILPISMYKEYEKYEQGAYWDPNNMQTVYTGGGEKDKLTYNKIDYIGFKIRSFAINNDKFKIGSYAGINIPFGGDKSSYISESHPLLSDGFLEFKGGVFTHVQMKAISLSAEFLYDYRAEDMSDMLLVTTQIGLTSVKNTELQGRILYGYALEDYDASKIFHPRQEVMWSNFLDIGFNFKFIFMENFEFNSGYRISLWGENGWNYGIFNAKLSYYF